VASGVCRSNVDVEYMEMRILTQDWESVQLENWLLQIILSEFLDVPTSVELGQPGWQMNFYHPFRAQDTGNNLERVSLANAAKYGDCLAIPLEYRSPDTPPYNQSDEDSTYRPCAHMVTEIWSVNQAWQMNQIDHIIEAPQGLGVLGEEGWFVPKFTGMRDPSILSYLGLQGEERRQKLAEMFLRPTTWGDYCKHVSETNCKTPDETALRPPMNETEMGRYFVPEDGGAFAGYFRATDENDCDQFPSSCTGHIADYPCGWTSNVVPQAHYLDIAVKSSGPEPGASGYSYESLLEIWHAANNTKSNVIMYWWTPDSLVDLYVGTDAEFTKIALPKPTQECVGKNSVVLKCLSISPLPSYKSHQLLFNFFSGR
jgi:hypothetical protein